MENHSKSPLLLNLGCGRNFHPDWRNLDLEPYSEEVEKADLSKGIPFSAESADAVYHSHVLEHLQRADGRKLILDCFRVLKPGGILRIAVPDLEQIAREYLRLLENCWESGNEIDLANFQWIKMELIDQMVRVRSGGEMARLMSDPDSANASFIRERLGSEIKNVEKPAEGKKRKPGFFARKWKRLRFKLGRWLLGSGYVESCQIAQFRQSGEVHQWMFDRVELREILVETGFVDFRVCGAEESRIDGFSEFHLDAVDGQPKKPDSLFVEAQKPETAIAAA